MRRFIMLLALLLGALLQSVLPANTLFGGLRPPIVVSLLIYYALRCKKSDMWLAVFWAALLYDSLEPGGFGPGLLAFPAVGWLAHTVRNEVFPNGIFTLILFGMLGSFIVMLVTSIIYMLTGARAVSFGSGLARSFSAMIPGMVTMPMVNAAMYYAELKLPKKREIRWK